MRRNRLAGVVLAYVTLELATLLGVPVRPEQVQEMTRLLKQAAVVRVERHDSRDEPPPADFPGRD